MESYENRIKDGVNRGIANSIWNNEAKTISKIIEVCKKEKEDINLE